MRIRGVLDKPAMVYGVLVPLLVVFWLLSGVGENRTPSDPGVLYRLSAIAWALFGLVFLLTFLYTVVLVVRRLAVRRSAAS